MVNLTDGTFIPFQDSLLDLGSGSAFSSGEIKHCHAQVFQVIVFSDPVISDDKDIDIQLPYGLSMIKRPLRNHDIGVLKRLDDGDPFLKRDDGRILIAGDQLIGADTDNQRIAQSAGILNHLKMIGMEHVKCSGGINDDSVIIHENDC